MADNDDWSDLALHDPEEQPKPPAAPKPSPKPMPKPAAPKSATPRPTVGNIAAKSCPKCGAGMDEAAIVCIDCGHHLRYGMNVGTIAGVKREGRNMGLAVALSLAAALLGGFLWFLLLLATEKRFSLMAILIGIGVGLVVRFVYRDGEYRAGMLAAGMAMVGVGFGNMLLLSNMAGAHIIGAAVRDQPGEADRLAFYAVLQSIVPDNDAERVGRSLLLDEMYSDEGAWTIERVKEELAADLEGREVWDVNAYDLYGEADAEAAFAAMGVLRGRVDGELSRDREAWRERGIKAVAKMKMEVFRRDFSFWQRLKMTNDLFDGICMLAALLVAFRVATKGLEDAESLS